MRYLLPFALLFVAACAPLNPNSSPAGKVGEVALRVIGCPLTLCFSELGLYNNYKMAQEREAYGAYYSRLSRDEQDREDRRQANAAIASGLALSGTNFLAPRPRIMTPAPLRQTCVAQQYGSTTVANCY